VARRSGSHLVLVVLEELALSDEVDESIFTDEVVGGYNIAVLVLELLPVAVLSHHLHGEPIAKLDVLLRVHLLFPRDDARVDVLDDGARLLLALHDVERAGQDGALAGVKDLKDDELDQRHGDSKLDYIEVVIVEDVLEHVE